jgi:hypothetical protein
MKILVFFLLLSTFGFSENSDTLIFQKNKNSTIFFKSESFGNLDSINYIDMALDNFQKSPNRNYLGNSGAADVGLFNNYTFSQLGFNYSKNNFKNYFYTKENLKFFQTHTPYTDLFYLAGSKREQQFNMTFSHNVKENWNIAVNFFRIRSEGFYLRQKTNDNFISLTSNYRSKDNRYVILFGIMYNYVQNNENGGISNDSLFENGAILDKKLLDINLQNANRANLNRSFFINQYFNFGKKTGDSLTNAIVNPYSRLLLSTLYEDNLLEYKDSNPTNDFYYNVFYDSISTYDSTYNLKFENELSWNRLDNKKHRGFRDLIGVGFSAKDQFIRVKQRDIDTTFNNIIFGGELYNMYSNRAFWWRFRVKYDLFGYNKNDYDLSASFKKMLFDSLATVAFNFSSHNYSPDFMYVNYSSNHFRWRNSFQKILENGADLNFSIVKYKFNFAIGYKEYTNSVYFDNYAVSRQYQGKVPVFSADLYKNFSFFNWHLNNSIRYQNVPDSTIIRLPKLVLEHSLFYENSLLKKALIIQIGASLFFVSEYYSNAYMPATAQFYLQDDKKYGNYPFIDFFINAKIKSVRMFFKIDHLNSGWMGNKYQITPGYPMNDRAFKLGISWRFDD